MSIAELKYIYQTNEGELSVPTENVQGEEIAKIEAEIKEKVSPEVFSKVLELMLHCSDMYALATERAYKVGFKDGVKVLKEIEALN